MVKRVSRVFGVVMLAACVVPLSFAQAKSPATVIKPKRSDKVAGLSEFIGKLGVNGYPMVLVKSEVDNQWWVQPKPQIDTRGLFRTSVTFGNEKTAPETKFHVVVVVLKDEAQANALEDTGTLDTIPVELLRSAEQVYTFSPEAKVDEKAGVLISPLAGQGVTRRTELKGNWPQGKFPMVAVRTDAPEGPWWIQPHPRVTSEGKLSGNAHFGNAKTPKGTKFRLAVYGLMSEKAREAFAPGAVCDKLPDESLLLDSFVIEAIGGDEAAPAAEVAPAVKELESAKMPLKPLEKVESRTILGNGITQTALQIQSSN